MDGIAGDGGAIHHNSRQEDMTLKKISSVAIVAAALMLGGCAVSAPTAPSAGAPTPSGAATPGASLPHGVTAATSVPTAVANDPGVRKDVTLTKCAATKAGWSAAGTAQNKKKGAKTFKITVFFTSPAATVLHTDSTTVTVKPGAKSDWTIYGQFTAPKGTLCVLRGVA